MKNINAVILFIFVYNVNGQVANYNQFPAMQPQHILDERLEDISFAFSLRVLESNYTGPLIRLRRSSDNAESDFYCTDNDMVNLEAIDTWRNGTDVFIKIWYDQSGLNRHAVQNINDNQPRFFTVVNAPFFQGDGINDHLTVNTPNGIQDVTNNGNQGTVLMLAKASTKNQHSFGVLISRDRWSTHINWGNNNLYFDPGICCNSTRFFPNTTSLNLWKQYSFIKSSTNATARLNGVTLMDGAHITGRCTRTENFAIGWATGGDASAHSTSSFAELIMYRTNINPSAYQEIEENTMTYWNL